MSFGNAAAGLALDGEERPSQARRIDKTGRKTPDLTWNKRRVTFDEDWSSLDVKR